MKKLIRTFKQILILIFAVTFLGCEEEDTNLPKVLADFTYTINADTGVVTFINLSTNATNYKWDFGDGSSATLINPVKAYQNGTYTIILKASVAAGASDTFEDEITILIPEVASLPITFDGANTKYDPTAFDGTSFEVIDNPAPGGTNNVASKVGAITNSGATYEGIFFELGSSIDLATDKTIKMNFWANASVDVLLKLEEGSASTPDIIVNHTGSGWEELSFNFTANGKYSKLVLFVDGPGTTAGTFYLDDIIQTETPSPPCTPEIAQSLNAADFNLTFQTDDTTTNIVDDGATMVRILNPDTDNMMNTSCYVGEITRDAALQYANNQINFSSPLDFSNKAGFKVKVWSPATGTKVTVKLEGGTVVEVTKTTTTANAWEELTFDFDSSISGNNKIVLFFNIDSFTTGTFYLDDFMLYDRVGGGVVCTPETTQSLASADFNLTFQTNPSTSIVEDGGDFEWIDNPDFNNTVNPSCKVGKVTRDASLQYANNQINFTTPLNFTNKAGFKIKVWSPAVGNRVTVKLEGGVVNEVTKTTTVANAWEELTFDFNASVTGNNKIVLFFNLDSFTTGVFFFDDFMLYNRAGGGGGGSGIGTCPAPPAGQLLSNGGFEANNGDGACWQFNPVGGTVAVSTTEANTGTYSAKLTTGKDQAPNLKMERFAPSIAGGVTVRVTFKYKITTALGVGSIFQVLAFSEKASGAGATQSNLGNAADSPLNTWNTFTNTFVTDPQTAEGISLLIQLTGSGNDGAAGVVYVDDVQVTQL